MTPKIVTNCSRNWP